MLSSRILHFKLSTSLFPGHFRALFDKSNSQNAPHAGLKPASTLPPSPTHDIPKNSRSDPRQPTQTRTGPASKVDHRMIFPWMFVPSCTCIPTAPPPPPPVQTTACPVSPQPLPSSNLIDPHRTKMQFLARYLATTLAREADITPTSADGACVCVWLLATRVYVSIPLPHPTRPLRTDTHGPCLLKFPRKINGRNRWTAAMSLCRITDYL